MKMNKAMLYDILYGALFGLISAPFIGWLSIPVSVASALLWMLGGIGWLGTAMWRKAGCPVALCGAIFIYRHEWPCVVAGILQHLVFRIGYGVPDMNDPEGSWLGRKFGKHTRLVWFGLLGLASLPLLLLFV